MLKLNVYSASGVKKEGVNLPKAYGLENLALMAQAIRVNEGRGHFALSKVKSRGEVKKSKSKIWRQKGTGRARHGARSAPIFVGGGVAHGPRGLKRNIYLPRKMRKMAVRAAISLAARKGKLVFVEGMEKIAKTHDAKKLLQKIRKDIGTGTSQSLIVLAKENKKPRLSFRNLAGAKVSDLASLNTRLVYLAGLIIMERNVFEKPKTVRKGSE